MVTVLEYKTAPTKHRIGVLSVLTEDKMFVLNCELVMWKKEPPHLWIRMPEMWKDGKKEVGVMAMPDWHGHVQASVLQQLQEKFGITFDECKRISKESMKQHMKVKHLQKVGL